MHARGHVQENTNTQLYTRTYAPAGYLRLRSPWFLQYNFEQCLDALNHPIECSRHCQLLLHPPPLLTADDLLNSTDRISISDKKYV